MKKIYRLIFIGLFLEFIVFFSVFLDVKKEISLFENRSLFEKTNIKNTTDVEKYVSDHIPFREDMLKIYFSANLKMPVGIQKILVGQDNWLFMGTNPTANNLPVIPSYQNKEIFAQKEINQAVHNIKRIKKWCDEHNVRLYLIFPPDKTRVYAQFMPDYIVRQNNLSPVERFVSFLPNDITVIPIERKLIDLAQKNYAQGITKLLYYKEESHWSEEGAFLAYQELMRGIKKDFSEVKILTRDDFLIEPKSPYNPYDIGYGPKFTHGNLILPNFDMPENLYNHFEYKNIKDIKVVWDKNFKHSTNSNTDTTPLNVYVIGDSFACYLHAFLSATFHRVRAYRFNMPRDRNAGIWFNERKKEFEEEKPDILILSISDLKLKDLLRID